MYYVIAFRGSPAASRSEGIMVSPVYSSLFRATMAPHFFVLIRDFRKGMGNMDIVPQICFANGIPQFQNLAWPKTIPQLPGFR